VSARETTGAGDSPVVPDPDGAAAGAEPAAAASDGELTESAAPAGSDGSAGPARQAGAPEPPEPVLLPEPVRQRVLALASAALGRLPAADVPASLRAAARFTPAKRARLAATALAAELDADETFRLRVAELAEEEQPAAAEAVRAGQVPAAGDAVELAVAAYLQRAPGWAGYVDRTRAVLAESADRARARDRDEELDRLRAQLSAAREAVREAADRTRASLAEIKTEVEALRKQLREQAGWRRAAERARTTAEEALAEEQRRAAAAESTAAAELRRLRQRLGEAEDAVEAARRAARESRQVDETRLWLLLDTVSGAVQGLRRQLALSPTEDRPADAVAAASPAPAGPAVRGDDPELLDRLLELPRVHLVVDGYNVTKTGYGDLPLAAQRDRLVQGLGALAARTAAEVSCVFDGAAGPPAMPPAPRGVRVLFSAPGEIADELIRRLVAAEPPGRPVVVVSSDREVADGVRRPGVYPVDAPVLLRRLGAR
jgi:predicted RNA-binding protein with PIN domain